MTSDEHAVSAEGGAVVDREGLSVTLDADSRASYALSVNRRPPVRSITIRNDLGDLGKAIRVKLYSEWTAADRPPIREMMRDTKAPIFGETLSVDFGESRLDDTALAYLDMATPAEIVVEVQSESGEIITTHRQDMIVQARNFWRHDLEVLTAAFVQFQHPALTDLRHRISQILAEKTGDGNLEGYQSKSPQRVAQMGAAVFEALRERISHYLMSPPKNEFAMSGQAVRPLDELFETGQGNCIELACAYATCMYSIGLDPVIFLVPGHAFGGFYLEGKGEGERWNKALTTEFSSIQALIEEGKVVALETTSIPGSTTFQEARRLVSDFFVEQNMESVIDVDKAFRQGVMPLPVRQSTGEVETIWIASSRDEPPAIERRNPKTRKLLADAIPVRVQQWQTALLDLGKRNPLINFDALAKGIQILTPPDKHGEIEDYLVEGAGVLLHGNDDINDALKAAGVHTVSKIDAETLVHNWSSSRVLFGGVHQLRRYDDPNGALDDKGKPKKIEDILEVDLRERARELNRNARQSEDDSGVNNLHIALGFVSWPYESTSAAVDKSITEVTSPVFLVPVRMNVPKGGNVVQLRLAEDSITTLNYSLVEALRRKLGVKLEWFDEDMSDDSGLDVERGISELRKELLASGWTDKGVRVDASMAVGLFPFQRVRLWKDLKEHWKDFLKNPVVHHMVENGFGAFHDPADADDLGVPEYDDLSLLNPQPADGAQTRAIVRALAGQSFVLEGPPGTGKSQTITNLLANALAAGNKVLFVAEKPDARSVVRERLQDVGLDPFCLDLHDQGSKPQEVKDQIREALDFAPEDVEEQWSKFEERYRSLSSRLQLYRDRVHGPTQSGKSYFDSYEELLSLGTEPSANIGRSLANVPADQIEEIRSLLLELSGYTTPAQVCPGHPWSFVPRQDFENIAREALADLIRAIASALPGLDRLSGSWATAIAEAFSPQDLSALLGAARQINSFGLPSPGDMVAIQRADWGAATDRAIEGLKTALSDARALSDDADAALIARDLSAQTTLVLQAAGGLFIGKKGRITTALGDLAAHPAFAGKNPAEIAALFTGVARASENYRDARDRLRRDGAMDIRILDDPITDEALATLSQRKEDLVAIARCLNTDEPFAEALRACINDATALAPADPLAAFVEPLTGLLSGSDYTLIQEWLDGRHALEAVRGSLNTWVEGADELRFLSLKRWLDLLNYLSPLQEEPFTSFRRQICRGDIEAEECVIAFERAQLKAVLAVVAEEFNFDVFDDAEHDRYAKLFAKLTEERQQILRKVIPARLHAKRAFDSNSRAGAVAALRTELSSKRRGARSVRNLITRYPGLISELTPCFLMSPDSVAKFIPVGSLEFDVIVFDEASQILVEEAVGAMGRAKSVVIVGDSKQMPPSAGFRTRLTADEDDLVEPDVDANIEDGESILEESVESGLNRELLAWHYRSRDEVLISFSNQHYYDGRLASFPSPHRSRPGIGIEYHFVPNGQFRHSNKATSTSKEFETQLDQKFGGPIGSNPIEADAIVHEAVRRVHSPEDSQFSIGIVTLNKKQAELIEKKLRDLNDARITDLLTTDDNSQRLLILNLENVQGRERDVIILGTSFSKKDPADSKMPLNFGPLNQAGGERRLNVAITRARRQVVVFSSFDPDLLAPANPQGMKDLHEYLLLAREASSDRDSLDIKNTPTQDLYRDQVAHALAQAGLTVRTGYGLSHFKVDIAVGRSDRPGEWLVAVLLDGHDWAERKLVLDRDGLPVTVLTNMMEWPAVARVWLPTWQRDPAEVVSGIVELVDLVATGREAPQAEAFAPDVFDERNDQAASEESQSQVSPTTAAPVNAPSPIETLEPPPVQQRDFHDIRPRPYTPPVIDGTLGLPEDLEHSGAIVREVLIGMANNVGPFTVEEGLKAVAQSFGLDRVRASRMDQLKRFSPRNSLVNTPFGQWLFPERCVDGGEVIRSEFTWYWESSFPERKIDQISPQELANSATPIVRGAFGVEIDELTTVLLDLFGYNRKTNDTRALVRDKIKWAVLRSYFVEDQGLIQPVEAS